jgi:hypothetical protein
LKVSHSFKKVFFFVVQSENLSPQPIFNCLTIIDLELFNHECTEVGRSSNPECKLEMEEKRQAIMHELESQIGLVESSHRKKEKEINDHAKASFASQLKRFHDIAEYEEH